MTTMTLRINDDDSRIIKKYAAMQHLSISEFARKAMLEVVEDECDLKELRQAIAEDDGRHVSHEDAMKAFGL